MGAADRPFNSLFAPPAVETIRRADGCILLRSPQELADHGRCLGDWLEYWADAAPDRPFLLERAPDGNWEGVTYRETVRQVYAIATWLMENGCSAERPTAILGDNGVRHALLALASMHVGIPVASLSSAYSLVSTDFGKLKSIVAQITPGVLYVPDTARYGAALAALRGLHDARIVADQNQIAATDLTQWDDLVRITDREAIQRAFAAVGPDTVAKLLFTSGSTGIPKAVVTTQRMLLVNQQQMRQVWPFLEDHVPVLVDWLPWSHTFGGNHNFNLVLRSGGTLYIDAGRPVAQKFDQTLANLREVAP
ncbi:MAG TPA: AMP-binding protein, partial [Steroidobacteraceae bacterium]|nr:AMP-binding protein [Steroidobacteraceae bacterium]